MSPVFDRQEVQGNILRGYRRDFVRHLILEVTDQAAARKFLGVSVAGGDAHSCNTQVFFGLIKIKIKIKIKN